MSTEQPPTPTPDYWLTLADDLRKVADRLAALAGTPTPPVHSAYLNVYANYSVADADTSAPVIDAIAAVFGVTAKTKTEGRGQHRQTERAAAATCGRVRVHAKAVLPNPPTRQEKLQTRAALEAELEQLRAQLAEGGAR